MTNQELNEQVARKLGLVKVFGNKPSEVPVTKNGEIIWPDYCGSIQAAWEIVEKLIKENRTMSLSFGLDSNDPLGGMKISFWFDDGKQGIGCYAETAPLAIVRAFLKLAG